LPQAWSSLCNCHRLHYFCFRLHDWYDPASLRTHSLSYQQFVRQESPCEGHHVLDTQPVFPLGCESATWQLSEATHDRSMWLDEVENSETANITNSFKLVEFISFWVYVVAQFVEALRYMPKGCGFNSRWCHWNFSLT
jgi:hypothetical protein